MTALHYAVTATLPDSESFERYLHWLVGGHMEAVVEAGALSATLTQIGETQVRAQYRFASRTDFNQYLIHAAPALRADGLARFGPQTGAYFSREIGEEVAHFSQAGYAAHSSAKDTV